MARTKKTGSSKPEMETIDLNGASVDEIFQMSPTRLTGNSANLMLFNGIDEFERLRFRTPSNGHMIL